MTTISPVVVPYAGGIPGGIKPGLEIEIQGTVPHHAHNGFSINLCQGAQREPTTTLHFNVRFHQNCIVLNHLHNGSWGGEDRKPLGAFHKGKPFDLRLIVKPQMFKFKVNGNHIADFAHRLPKETAQFLVIDGEVSVSYITFKSGGAGPHGAGGFPPPAASSFPSAPGVYPSYPTPQPHPHPHPHHHHHGPGGFVPPPAAGFTPPPMPYPTGPAPVPAPQPSYGPQPIFNPAVPFLSGIPGGMTPGRMISVSGVPLPNAKVFTINLQCGTYEGCDIALHFNVRIRTPDGTVNTIVRNSFQNGGWGGEERNAPYFPFMPNANFDIIILAEPQVFKVAVNNQHLLEFRHRVPIQAINTMRVDGDLRITQVRFQ